MYILHYVNRNVGSTSEMIFGASSAFVTHASHPTLSNLFGYVEWFTKPRAVPHETMEMFEIDHQMWLNKLQ